MNIKSRVKKMEDAVKQSRMVCQCPKVFVIGRDKVTSWTSCPQCRKTEKTTCVILPTLEGNYISSER